MYKFLNCPRSKSTGVVFDSSLSHNLSGLRHHGRRDVEDGTGEMLAWCYLTLSSSHSAE